MMTEQEQPEAASAALGDIEWRLVNFMSCAAEQIMWAMAHGDVEGKDAHRLCHEAARFADRCEHVAQEAINRLEGRELMLANDFEALREALPYLRKALREPYVGSLPSDSDMEALKSGGLAAGVPIPPALEMPALAVEVPVQPVRLQTQPRLSACASIREQAFFQ